MKYYFKILITLSIIFAFSFFFKVTKTYGNNKFIPPVSEQPQQKIIGNACKIAQNPFFYNQNFHT